VNRLQVMFSIGIALAGVLAASAPADAHQESDISITRQPGILYLPSHVMEKQQLIEEAR